MNNKILQIKFPALANSASWLFTIFIVANLSFAANALAGADVDYVLSAPRDPAQPGHVAEFDLTARNLSASTQSVSISFTVPQFTTYEGNGAVGGTETGFILSNIAAGSSKSQRLLFLIEGGNMSPPDGTVINLTLVDSARGASVSRDVVVQSIPVLDLQLATEQATVAPGGNFTYTLVASNISAASHSGVTLSVPVPAGASFVSADDGGTLDSGTVSWNLGTLTPSANQQVHVTFQASSIVNTPLGAVNAMLSDSAGDVARASDMRGVFSAPTFDYVITAPTDPVQPGHVAEFDITARNLSSSTQSIGFDFTVPKFTTYEGNGAAAETETGLLLSGIAPGASKSARLLFLVNGANLAPPNGTTINLVVSDLSRAASVSRSIVLRSAPVLNLQLATEQATVAPGGDFTYTLTAANISAASHSGVTLSVPVPAGASFVSADGGGTVSSGSVSWTLGTLGIGTDHQRHVTFKASGTSNTPLGPVDATLTDNTGDVARASDTRVVYSAPTFDYTITALIDPVQPGHVAEFDITARNLSASSQSVAIDFTVPKFTTYNGNGSGAETETGFLFGSIAAGASKTERLLFTVAGANLAPPSGTIITLNLMDLVRGASISKTIRTGTIPLPKADFNGDLKPDWILEKTSTRQVAIWFENNGTLLGSGYAPTLPAGWALVDADQFGGAANSADLLLFNPSTHRSAIWYLNRTALLSGVYGPTLPSGWALLLSHDFNNDGKPDLLLYQASTHRTAVWYLNGAAYAGGVFGPTLPAGWIVAGVSDFDGDKNADLLLYQSSTRRTVIWYLNAAQFVSSLAAPTLPSGWVIGALDDFNRDGRPDFVLWNPSTHKSAIWYLNNSLFVGSRYGTNIPAGWLLSAPR